jgi:GTP-binding protein HflX
VALCGYTNAGKSTLFRSLTGAEVYVADKLFATLDTTVRQLHPEPRRTISVSDTVGFIRNLPTKLVASFKTTLDEALEAGLILHVVDASDPAALRHIDTTCGVLAEIGAAEVPQLIVFNKTDRLPDGQVPDEWTLGLLARCHLGQEPRRCRAGAAAHHRLLRRGTDRSRAGGALRPVAAACPDL